MDSAHVGRLGRRRVAILLDSRGRRPFDYMAVGGVALLAYGSAGLSGLGQVVRCGEAVTSLAVGDGPLA